MQQSPALATQRRNVILVTRVLPAPLWLLVISILAFALAGIVLTIAAFAIGQGDTREYQARLTLMGLLAHTVEGEMAKRPVKDFEGIFEEKLGWQTRVGMMRSLAGGYEYTTLQEMRN